MLALGLATGCQHSVKIEYPGNGNSKDPIRDFRVKFHSDADPATFSAKLNGVDITSRFQPAPAPGQVSFASSDFMKGWQQTLEVHASFKTPSSGIPTKSTNDMVQFTPPGVFVFLGNSTSVNNLSVKERDTIRATVMVVDPPTREGLVVTLTTEENPAVSLNNAAAGTPITVTIPINDRRADFTVRGIQAGQSFIVRPLAKGYGSHAGSGTVMHP